MRIDPDGYFFGIAIACRLNTEPTAASANPIQRGGSTRLVGLGIAMSWM
jgi:hypothetical protein